ncbi:MAG: nucleotidyltransferase family protein [Aestuariivita sp.]|nr:nucleotidyltransferase family protein [Aestuariivita sp.]
MISALILAAGFSRRMRGRDKLLEAVNGYPCIKVLADRANQADLNVYIVIPNLKHPRALAVQDYNLIVSENTKLGMAHSLKAGILGLPEEVTAVIVLLGDMPEITTNDLLSIIRTYRISNKFIVQATTSDGTPGHPVLFSRKYFGELTRLSGDRGAWKVIERHKDDQVFVPLPEQHAKIDLDTPEDWKQWKASQIKRLDR